MLFYLTTVHFCLGEYYDLGDPSCECQQCGANMWYMERKNKSRHSANPKFSMCCGEGKVQIPLLRQPPPVLQSLLFEQNESESKIFQQQIRLYNMMFAFTSPGAKMDNRFNNGRGPPNYRIQGQTCHRIGSMLPLPGEKARFAQLYIYDTEHEVQNRFDIFRFLLYTSLFQHCILFCCCNSQHSVLYMLDVLQKKGRS